MSHFSKNTKVFVTDMDAFVAACRELGINGKVENDTTIKDYYGAKTKVARTISLGRYDIGLVKEDEGRYSIVGDWMMMRHELPASLQNMTDEQLQNKILQKTTEKTIVSRYEAEGFNCEVVPDNKSGAVQITLTRDGGRFA